MIRDWRLTLSAARPEFIRPVTLVRMRRMRTKSINYFASLRELAPLMVGVGLDFAASRRSHVTAISLEPSKELWREESLMKCEEISDSGTIQFSFLMDSRKLSVNCPPK